MIEWCQATKLLRTTICCLGVLEAFFMCRGEVRCDEPLRAGIIGCDTSHAPAFTKIINTTDADLQHTGVLVVAAFPDGSDDIPSSRDRVSKFTDEFRVMGVDIVDSIDALLKRVDVVLLESVDGRKHLSQVRPVLAAGKPVFIDKPLAGSLADALEIIELAEEYNTPFFTSSALRFTPAIHAARAEDSSLGSVIGCAAYSPCHLEPHHPDIFWYGIHGVETLFTIMGKGCEKVTRFHANDVELLVGVWGDGRIGTYRGQRSGKQDYGSMVFGDKSNRAISGFGGYKPLVEEIVRFFETRHPPVSADETLEILAFMEAADESKRQGGAPVSLESVLRKAHAVVDARQKKQR